MTTTGGITLRGSSLLHEETVPMLATNESKVSYTYPLSGAYSLRVVFRAGGRDISSGTFVFDVDQGSTGGSSGFPWVRLGLTLLLGVFIGSLLSRRSEDRSVPVEAAADDADVTPDVGSSTVRRGDLSVDDRPSCSTADARVAGPGPEMHDSRTQRIRLSVGGGGGI